MSTFSLYNKNNNKKCRGFSKFYDLTLRLTYWLQTNRQAKYKDLIYVIMKNYKDKNEFPEKNIQGYPQKMIL